MSAFAYEVDQSPRGMRMQTHAKYETTWACNSTGDHLTKRHWTLACGSKPLEIVRTIDVKRSGTHNMRGVQIGHLGIPKTNRPETFILKNSSSDSSPIAWVTLGRQFTMVL